MSHDPSRRRGAPPPTPPSPHRSEPPHSPPGAAWSGPPTAGGALRGGLAGSGTPATARPGGARGPVTPPTSAPHDPVPALPATAPLVEPRPARGPDSAGRLQTTSDLLRPEESVIDLCSGRFVEVMATERRVLTHQTTYLLNFWGQFALIPLYRALTVQRLSHVSHIALSRTWNFLQFLVGALVTVYSTLVLLVGLNNRIPGLAVIGLSGVALGLLTLATSKRWRIRVTDSSGHSTAGWVRISEYQQAEEFVRSFGSRLN